MAVSNLERIEDFEHRFAKAQSTDVIELPFGYGILQREFPLSQYHNRIAVTSPAAARQMAEAADDLLGGAGLRHRYVSTHDCFGEDLSEIVAALTAAGFEYDPIVTMIYTGPAVAPPRHEVAAVSLRDVRPMMISDARSDIADGTEEQFRQLADRTSLYSLGAEHVRLAVYDGDQIAARADLYLDRADGIAQFENLNTAPKFRGRGYGTALLHEGLLRGRQAGKDLVFLTADLNDWPREWYARDGFAELTRTHHFSRTP